jgi:hypothetical protein
MKTLDSQFNLMLGVTGFTAAGCLVLSLFAAVGTQPITQQYNAEQAKQDAEAQAKITAINNQAKIDKALTDKGYVPFDQLQFAGWNPKISPPPLNQYTGIITSRKIIKDKDGSCAGFWEPDRTYHSRYEYQGHPEITYDPEACSSENVGTPTKGISTP